MRSRYIRGLSDGTSSATPPQSDLSPYADWQCYRCVYNIGEGPDPADIGGPALAICSSLTYRGRQVNRYVATLQKYHKTDCPGFRDIATVYNGRKPISEQDIAYIIQALSE